jgi:hypothetical protein
MHASHCAVAVDCGGAHCIALCRQWSDNDPVVLARRAAAANTAGASGSGSAPAESHPAYADAFMPGRLSSEGGELLQPPRGVDRPVASVGVVWTWGCNRRGQLGRRPRAASAAPSILPLHKLWIEPPTAGGRIATRAFPRGIEVRARRVAAASSTGVFRVARTLAALHAVRAAPAHSSALPHPLPLPFPRRRARSSRS